MVRMKENRKFRLVNGGVGVIGLGLPRRCGFCVYAPITLLRDGRVVVLCALRGEERELDDVCPKWRGEW